MRIIARIRPCSPSFGDLMGKCNHPLMAWAFRGSRSGPDKNNNFTLYDCLECGIRFRYYFNQNRVEELPKNIGLIPAIW